MSKIYLATDHAGFELKEKVKKYLEEHKGDLGITDIEDCGAHEYRDGDNYPEYIAEAAKKIEHDALHAPSIGIVFGGSGQGEAIVANRFRHVRAIVYAGGNLELVKLGREHNDANVLSIGARFVSYEQAHEALELFLKTSFSHEERHAERVISIDTLQH
ncbi:MAG: ribose 5-phosphate isomerase [Patescibacteria group bacterium]|nr:ribose 5-phosphate isomerase [Patescibacteria group bacterium]